MNKLEIVGCRVPLLSKKEYILFAHASYEERSIALKQFRYCNGKLVAGMIIYSEEYKLKKKYKLYLCELKDIIKYLTKSEPIMIPVHRDKPVKYIFDLHEKLSKFNDYKSKNFLVDMSTFPRDRLICLVDYLKKIKFSSYKLEFIYTIPLIYHTQTKDGWLTKGVRKIMPVPGFNGIQRTNRKTLLVIMLGLEEERSYITIRNTEPNKLIVISYELATDNEHIDKPEILNSRLIQNFSPIILEKHKLKSGFDEVKRILENIYQCYSGEYNIFISINGLKSDLLGAMIVCRNHRDIQIKHAYPHVYNINDYSTGIGKSFYGFL